MKNYVPSAIVICFASAIYGLVILRKGYKDATQEFYGYENQPRKDVERNLSIIMPNVQFKVYKCPDLEIFNEEEHIGNIIVLVNNGTFVIFPPKYHGAKPDQSFTDTLMGEGYESTNTIREHIQKTNINLKSKQDVERNLSHILPKVQFKVYNCPDQGIFKEEKHFGKIVLIVNSKNVVIVPPKYYGVEPDLSFALPLLEKGYKNAINEIREHIENPKIVVQLKRNCTIIWQSTEKKRDYILVEISPDNKVIELPKFIRVPKE